jgi:hypothetical protein
MEELCNSLELLFREQVLARELQKQRVDEAYNLAEQAGIKPTGPPPESQLVGAIANSIHKVKMEIGSLESDFTSSQLRKSAELIGSADLGDWVDFDFSFSQVKSQKRSLLYIAITTALGGIVGSMYVLISKAIRNRREHMLKA